MTSYEDPKHDAPKHELAITVSADDVDELGHVNNVVYLRWVQDAAEAHWREVGTDVERSRFAWIVLRHEIDYLHPAETGDGVVARTWVVTWRGARSDRRVDVIRVRDSRLLARSRTTYCSVDAATLKPLRIPSDIRRRFLPDA